MTGIRNNVVTGTRNILLVDMDARLIMQVLINLINNAIKYTPEDAVITIGAKADGKMVVLWVEDEGEGVPEGSEDKVFEMFYTGVKRSPDSRRGIGLGRGFRLIDPSGTLRPVQLGPDLADDLQLRETQLGIDPLLNLLAHRPAGKQEMFQPVSFLRIKTDDAIIAISVLDGHIAAFIIRTSKD